MSDSVPTWAELMNRHRASCELFVSAQLECSFLVRDDLDEASTFDIWHGPGARWRIEVAKRPVYIRRGRVAFALKKNAMHRQEPAARQFTVLQPVNPLWFFGPSSLLSRCEDFAPEVAAIATEVDGRNGWSIVTDQMTLGARSTRDDSVEFVIDDETGLVLRIGSVNGRLSGALRAVQIFEQLPDSLFEWTGEVAGSTNPAD